MLNNTYYVVTRSATHESFPIEIAYIKIMTTTAIDRLRNNNVQLIHSETEKPSGGLSQIAARVL